MGFTLLEKEQLPETLGTGNTAYAGVLAVQGNYNLQLGTNGVIRQTIDGSGNVGIGTTTPDYKLEVQGVISSADAGLQKATFANVGNDLVLTANADSTNVTANILFKSSGSGGSSVSEKMRIDGSGNVGIGVTDPVTKLEVEGSTNGIITMNSTGGTGGRMDFAHTGSNYGNVGSGKNLTGTGNATDMMVNADSVLYLGVGSKDVTINSSHNVGIGTTSPTSPTSVTRFLEIEGTTAGIVLHDDGNDAWDLFASGGKLGTRYNNSVEGWWLDHNGLMGVGTTAPVSKLHVQGGDIGVTTGQKIGWIYNPGGDNNMYNYLKTADDGGVPASHLEISGANWTSGNVAGVKFTHVVTGDLMTIMTGGNVGIGTTAPTANLHVVGSAASQPTVNIQAPGSGGAHLRLWDTTGGSSPYIEFGEGGSTTFTRKGFIQMSGDNIKIAAEYGEFQVWTGTNGSNEDQRLTVTSAGNVGIGETSASYKLRIKTDATLDNGIYLSAGDSSSNHALYVENLAGSAELLAVRGDGEVRINGSGTGDCKIGTTTGTPSGGGFVFDNGTDSILRIGHASGVGDGSNYVLFYYSTNIIGSITQSGTTAIAYNTSSDYRLKEDLKDFNGLDKVSKIPVYDFKWKVDESRSYGVMAHELQKVLPQAVTGNKDAEEMQGVDYSKIVPMLIKSVQELKIEIEELKIKIK